MKRRDRIQNHYIDRIRDEIDHHAVLDWENADAQRLRFSALADNLALQGQSLLDVGAGLGDLWAYLKQRGLEVNYHGVDILPDMVSRACAAHPEARFTCADIFTQPDVLDQNYDVVYTSGIFNLNLDNNERFLREALQVFFRIARRHVVFNLLHERSTDQESRYWYTTPDRALAILREFTDEVRIIDDYLPNDFTVVGAAPQR
ncbi:MAG: class I SAM-dependent methyltransferase [Candidatus Cloacimonetes bacterium]|nr:class I SAM-dependent methyltransferase [Candidatus Cloacimonadota bacterium]